MNFENRSVDLFDKVDLLDLLDLVCMHLSAFSQKRGFGRYILARIKVKIDF